MLQNYPWYKTYQNGMWAKSPNFFVAIKIIRVPPYFCKQRAIGNAEPTYVKRHIKFITTRPMSGNSFSTSLIYIIVHNQCQFYEINMTYAIISNKTGRILYELLCQETGTIAARPINGVIRPKGIDEVIQFAPKTHIMWPHILPYITQKIKTIH